MVPRVVGSNPTLHPEGREESRGLFFILSGRIWRPRGTCLAEAVVIGKKLHVLVVWADSTLWQRFCPDKRRLLVFAVRDAGASESLKGKQMHNSQKLKEITVFIADYASVLLGSGVHCTRVIRNSKRICESFGLDIKMTVFASSIILTLIDQAEDEMCTEVVVIPQVPVSFELNAELSALSWRAHDNPTTIGELRAEYEALLARPRLNSWIVTFMVSLANACFCRLFEGNLGAMAVVFVTTFIGFRFLRFLKKNRIDHFLAVLLVSFVSSALASLSVFFDSVDANIAVATSVLFMVPGVPMITGVIDILENHTLIGFARLMRAVLIVLCLAVGLSISMVIFQKGLL